MLAPEKGAGTQTATQQGDLMARRYPAFLSLALAALLLPIAANAQERQPPPEVQEWMREMQQIQIQLQPIQQQALQDPAVQQEQQEVSRVVREAIVSADPANGERLDRMEAILEEARSAQEAGDTAKLAALTSEAADLQPRVEAAQAEALAQPQVEARVAQFQDNLRAKMIELDPAAEERIERLQQLAQRVQEAMGRTG
jgi:hypothetical protein